LSTGRLSYLTLPAAASPVQAQSALAGLLPAGGGGSLIGTDYGGAIDVLEVLQGVLDEEALLGLDCFRCGWVDGLWGGGGGTEAGKKRKIGSN
jgi:hypothetical protein